MVRKIHVLFVTMEGGLSQDLGCGGNLTCSELGIKVLGHDQRVVEQDHVYDDENDVSVENDLQQGLLSSHVGVWCEDGY